MTECWNRCDTCMVLWRGAAHSPCFSCGEQGRTGPGPVITCAEHWQSNPDPMPTYPRFPRVLA